jgi:hypothetical protein
MNRRNQMINDRYEAMMFAKNPESARRAAQDLVEMVLGEDALAVPFEEALRQTCRKLRPSEDPREQARFEAEFLELAMLPPTSHEKIAA